MSGSSAPMAADASDSRLDALITRVRAFVEECAIPREDLSRAHDIAWLDAVTRELRAEAAKRGLVLPQLPKARGGLGLSWVECVRVFGEAGRSFLGVGALGCTAPDQPNVDTLLRIATHAQQQRWLAPLLAGQARSAFSMTEPTPGAGSDPRMITTTARRVSDGWALDGHKWFSSGAVGAAFALVVTRSEQGPSWFIVDTDNPGWKLVRSVPSIDPFAHGSSTACAASGWPRGRRFSRKSTRRHGSRSARRWPSISRSRR